MSVLHIFILSLMSFSYVYVCMCLVPTEARKEHLALKLELRWLGAVVGVLRIKF